jgi:hypothetical protein
MTKIVLYFETSKFISIYFSKNVIFHNYSLILQMKKA